MLASDPQPVSDFAALIGGTPLEECFAFWRAARVDGLVPKARIDPVAMPRHILPYLFIYDRGTDGRFRCRLSGTGLCEAFQIDATGLYLEEFMPPGVLADRLALYETVLARALPVAFVAHIAETDRSWMKFCRLMLPISVSGTVADAIFGMVWFPDFDPRRFVHQPMELGALEAVAWAELEDLIEA